MRKQKKQEKIGKYKKYGKKKRGTKFFIKKLKKEEKND
jgi:hypothetical protein